MKKTKKQTESNEKETHKKTIGVTVVFSQVVVLGASQESVKSTLNDVLASYNSSTKDNHSNVLPGLVATTYQLQAINGKYRSSWNEKRGRDI